MNIIVLTHLKISKLFLTLFKTILAQSQHNYCNQCTNYSHSKQNYQKSLTSVLFLGMLDFGIYFITPTLIIKDVVMETLLDVPAMPAIQEWLFKQQRLYQETKNTYYMDNVRFAMDILRTESLKLAQGLVGVLK